MKFIPIAADGWRFIIPLGMLGTALLFLRFPVLKIIGLLFLVLAFFCVYFFRDFERKTRIDEALIYSPGDGTVLAVEREIFEGQDVFLVRIFLSIFNVHVQRAPVSGSVERYEYRKGQFLDARDNEAHIKNEQASISIQGAKGLVRVTQVAGLIARRVVCWVKVGDKLTQGDRYGLIRFGSQVDIRVPAAVEILVQKGNRVRAGETVIGKWPN